MRRRPPAPLDRGFPLYAARLDNPLIFWYLPSVMDSIFYRKAGAGGGIRGAVARLRTNRRMVLVLVIGLPVALYVLFGPRGIVARIQISSERARLEEELRQAEAETRRLQAESKALEGDTRAIEKVARERYGMVKEGETVYRVKRND